MGYVFYALCVSGGSAWVMSDLSLGGGYLPGVGALPGVEEHLGDGDSFGVGALSNDVEF